MRPMSPELHHLFHTLWSRAVDRPEYVKADWLALERHLLMLSQNTEEKN